jgi:predicted RNA-binding protein YlxR (DUF448 family)
VGCGAVRPKGELRRIVLSDGRLRSDPAARRPGRGAYVCDRACAERALGRRGFERSFRARVAPGHDLLDSL